MLQQTHTPYQPGHLVYYQESGWAQGLSANCRLAVFVDPAALGIDPYDAGAGPIAMRVDDQSFSRLVADVEELDENDVWEGTEPDPEGSKQ